MSPRPPLDAHAGEGKTPPVDEAWAHLVEHCASIANDCKDLDAQTRAIQERTEPLRKLAEEALRLWGDLYPDLRSALDTRNNLRTRTADQKKFVQPTLRKKLTSAENGLAGLEKFSQLVASMGSNGDLSQFATGMDETSGNDHGNNQN